MKLHQLIAVFIITTMGSPLMAADFSTVKVSDGTAVTCQDKADHYKGRFGAYLLKAGNLSFDQVTNKVIIDLDLLFLKCSRSDQRFGFKLKDPFDPVSYSVIRGNEVEAHLQELKLRAYKDGRYQLLVDRNLADGARQNVRVEMDLEDLINEDQLLKLEEGELVKGNVDFFLIKKFLLKTAFGQVKRNIPFGSFRIHFAAKRSVSKGLRIKALR